MAVAARTATSAASHSVAYSSTVGPLRGDPALLEAAREEAKTGEQLSLPCFADRLEGQAAGALGDVAEGLRLLGRSADGFAALGGAWDEAWSRLLLAELVAPDDPGRADRELAASLPVFERLGSVQEADRARAARAKLRAAKTGHEDHAGNRERAET